VGTTPGSNQEGREKEMTPQTQLTLSNLFDGKEIRIAEQSNDYWWIVADLSKAWDLHRNTLNDIIGRHEWKFAGNYTTIAHGSCAGLIGVNEVGVYLLMGAVHINQVKNEKAKTAIKKFNKAWPELVKAYRQGEVMQVTLPLEPLQVIKQQLDLADIAIERSDIPKEVAHKMAWALAGTITKNELATSISGYIHAQPKQLQITEGCKPTDQGDFDSHFSLKYIANILKLSEDKTRNILESKNILCYKNQRWHLTTYGEQYGKAFKVQIGYPYRNIQQVWIRYNPELIKLLRLEYHIEPAKVE
jgi:prophage antirepressor-like protein